MSELSIPNTLPAQLVVLPLEIIEQKDHLIEQAATIVVADPDSLRVADIVQKGMVSLYRKVEENRLGFGRELDAVRAAVKAAAEEALEPLRLMQADLGKRIKAYTDAEKARYEEAKRKAEEDRARLQAEEDKRAQEAAELAADPDQPASEVPLEGAAMPVRVATAYVPPPPKSQSVRGKPPKLEMDEKLLPFEVNGIRLWKEPNVSAIKALLAAGVKVPGCAMVADDGVAVKGARS